LKGSDIFTNLGVKLSGGANCYHNHYITVIFVVRTLSRNQRDKEYIRQDIEYILQRIQEDLLRVFLVVPLRDENGIRSAPIISDPKISDLKYGCPDGSYLTDNGCSTWFIFCL